MIGYLISGWVITKFMPPAKYLFFWNVIIGILGIFGQMLYASLGCDTNNINLINGTLESCNSNCYCDEISYTPICNTQTNETYFSPCHAGCISFDPKQNVYTNCSCTRDRTTSMQTLLPINITGLIGAPQNAELNRIGGIISDQIEEFTPKLQQFLSPDGGHGGPTYTPGPCANDCTKDLIILSVLSLFVSLISSTGRVGNILVDLR